MQRLFFIMFCGLYLSLNLSAQNLNTTFRARMPFPGQSLANLWGYTANGKEYALLGGSHGMIIVDVTNPEAPQQIVQIPGPNNLWKEIKTYSHYAYITSEGGQGLQVVDLQNLPSPNLDYHFYTGDSTIAGQLNRLHALHIDETKGFLYGWGSANLFNGGAIVLDLKQDPYNPKYAGKYNQLGYIHDGFVDNDTMYSGHIYAGQFAIVNMANKAAPELIATQNTPDRFTHNTWPTDDRRTLFTTDERTNSFLAAFDISDPLDIKFLDKIQSNPGSNSIVHNTYVLGNYVVTAWYKDGFTIVDATRPDNLVQVGNYDTYPGSGDGFNGCWGVYPFLPSGNIIVSNINEIGAGNGELWIITPQYHRGCYLEGRVTDAKTGFPINNATIEILASNPLIKEHSNQNGFYKAGQAASGNFQVSIRKRGYFDYETTVTLSEGNVVNLDVALIQSEFTVSGTVRRQSNNQLVADAGVWLYGVENYNTTTDASGAFSISEVKPGTYDIITGAAGKGMNHLVDVWIQSDTSLALLLYDKYRREGIIPQNNGCLELNSMLSSQNPFSGSTTLSYETPETGCSLNIMNSAGQSLSTVQLTEKTGDVTIGQDLPRGLYFVRLELGDKVLETLKLVKSE